MIADCPSCGAGIECRNEDVVQCAQCGHIFMVGGDDQDNSTISIELIHHNTVSVDIAQYTGGKPDLAPTLNAPLADLHSRYRVISKIAEGGTSTVSIAQDRNLRRFVAVKTLKSEQKSSASVADFIAEAKVVAQLDHPGIIPVYGLAGGGSSLHLCMKLVNGRTLRETLRSAHDTPAALRQRLEVFLRVCDAISYAHSRNIIHGDLKPENVIVGEHGEVYVADWGLAHEIGDTNTTAETIKGTPRYFAPEAIREGKSTVAAEVFTLGLILQEVVTLRSAVAGSSDAECMSNIEAGALRPVRGTDKRLAAVIRKATAHDPGDRYTSVAALADDLRSYLADEPVTALREGAFARFSRWMVRHRRGVAAAILAVLFLSTGVTAVAVYRRLQVTREAHQKALALDYLADRTVTAASNLDLTGLQIQEQLLALARISAYLLVHNTGAAPDAWCSAFRPSLSEIGISEAGMIYSPYYKRLTSMEFGLYQIAPGADRARSEAFMRRTAPALRKMRNIVLGSIGGYNFDPADYERLKMSYLYSGAPVRSVYVGTEDGLTLLFPWRGSYPRAVDPRGQGWYKRAQDRRAPVWGKPYMDVNSVSGLSIPCSAPIIGLDGMFRGVAGLDLSVNKLVERILARGNVGDYVVGKAVIDRQGREVFSSKSPYYNRKFDPDKIDSTEPELPLFSSAWVRDKILSSGKEYGTFVAVKDGRRYVYSFALLEVWNMFFVTVADYEKLIERARK